MAGDIREWLEALGLGKYAETFIENDVDIRALPHLNRDDLKELGVSLGHRKVILAAISELNTGDEVERRAEVATWPTLGGLEAEQRQLTLMFCDLVDSTALSLRIDPEDLREVMRRYQDAVAGAVVRYGGHVAKFLGDGVMAYFGWPQAYEDQADRAIRASLDALSAVQNLTLDNGESLQARVGIASGGVVVGDIIGDTASEAEAVTGEAPNLAARLLGVAEPGQVVISATTRRLIGVAFELEDLGLHDLKGFSKAVQAWRVIGEGTAESRFEATHASMPTRLVGREHELGLLRARWGLAKGGEGQVVLLSGEAGIGKSRMVQALRDEIGEEPHFRLRYQCSPHHTNSAFYPIIRRLERAAGFSAVGDPDSKLDKLEALLKPWTEDLDAVAPLFAALLSLPAENRYGALHMTPQERRDRTIEAMIGQVLAMSRKRPVLIVLEDAHWIDPTTESFITETMARMADAAIFMLITYRPDYTPPWSDLPHLTSVALNRLGHEKSAEVAHAVGGCELSDIVIRQIIARADGVPLYLEELTRSVIEAGVTSADPLDHNQVPETLQASLIARLDRLGKAKHIAQVGSVVGREFPYHLLVAVVEMSGADVNTNLDRLVQSKLVFRKGVVPDATFTFKHALVQEAAYESQLRSKRQRLHGRLAMHLKEHFSEQADVEPEVLAHHYTEADLPEEAIGHWRRAGEGAAERAAHMEAIGHFTRGLKVRERLPEGPEQARTEVALLIGLAASMRVIDRYDDALKALDRAESISKDYSFAEQLAEIHYLRGNVFFPLGNLDGCLQQHELSRNYARRAGSPEAEARALGGLGDAYYMRARMITAHRHFEACIDLCREHDLGRYEVANRAIYGCTHFYQNDLTSGLASALTAAQSAKELGEHRSEMLGRLVSGEILANMTDLARAKAQIETSQTLVRRLGAWRFEALNLCCMAKILRAEGHCSEALGLLMDAIEISRRTGLSFSGPVVLGAIALTTDDPIARRDALSEGEELLKAGSVSHNHFRFYRDTIEAMLRANDWDNADRLAAALHEYTSLEPLPWTDFYISRARALAAHGRGKRDDVTRSEIRRLTDLARRVDLRLALPLLERALDTW